MNVMNRREFVRGVGAAAGAGLLGGCEWMRPPETSFYGPTIRDRLWMWGHHPDAAKAAESGFDKSGTFVDQAEGCRLMGIPNDCVIRWCNLPKRPWGNYFEQFRSLKRFSFGITDGAVESTAEKLRIAFEELQPNFPNLTGCFLDDFFIFKSFQDGLDLAKTSEEIHARGLRLSIVLYSDQNGLKPEYRETLRLCDETSYWFWKSSNIGTMADSVRRCRDFIGPEKDLLLGLYMWDFGARHAVSGKLMEEQLEYARRFLADRTVTGLIFHPTFIANLDLDSVRLSKEWIKSYGEDLWGK